MLEAADLGLDIVAVLETHVHADFVSCARELAETTGAPHRLHEAATGLVRYDFEPLADGESVRVGQVEIRAIHTPGHTPEHTAYLVTDHARADEPWCVLTGDSLFVGDVGRPDLLVGDQALDVMDEGERAATQFASIRDRLFTLPDHVEVYPNHYGGSTCGGVNMSGKPVSTIGFERATTSRCGSPTPRRSRASSARRPSRSPTTTGASSRSTSGLITREKATEARDDPRRGRRRRRRRRRARPARPAAVRARSTCPAR